MNQHQALARAQTVLNTVLNRLADEATEDAVNELHDACGAVQTLLSAHTTEAHKSLLGGQSDDEIPSFDPEDDPADYYPAAQAA